MIAAVEAPDHEMYQRAMNAELRASYHVEDRKRPSSHVHQHLHELIQHLL